MDATCAIQASIHVFSLVRKYVSRILGTYHSAVPVIQEKIKSPDFRGEYGVTSVTPFLFASISSAE